MKYRLLGNSGLRVAEAALGTMTFGDEWGWGSPRAREKWFAQLGMVVCGIACWFRAKVSGRTRHTR
jgi:hypothetical protein